MNCEGEFAKKVGGFFGWVSRFKFSPHALETLAQCDGFLGVPEFPEQAFDGLNQLQGGTNRAKGFRRFGFAALNRLQKQAFKFAAVGRSLRINFALATGERSAGLREFPGLRFCNQRQPQCLQPRGIIPRTQLDIGKNHPIAAKAAFPAD